MELIDAHREALHETGHLVARVRDDQWDRPSNCDGWTVRDLVNHVVSGNYWVKELVGGRTIDEVGDALEGDLLGDDPTHAYEESAQAADDAFSAPGAMEKECAVSYGPIPGSAYCADRFLDVLIHGWDLGVSSGQTTALNPELVEVCWAGIEPHLEMLAASGAFGTPVDVPDDAPLADRLLGALGRANP